MITRSNYACWMLEHLTRAEILLRARDLLRRMGPSMSDYLRSEFDQFLDEQSSGALAEFVAANVRPEEDGAFLDGCRELLRESRDPYIRHGVRPRDFL